MQPIEENGQVERDALSGRIRAIVEEVIAGTPLFVIDVTVRGRQGSQAVDVFLESDEGLGVNTLADVSREIEFLLDTEEVVKGRYSLNVSSPGVDRPLSSPRQYRKNVGRTVRVHYRDPEAEGNKEVVGELLAADDEGIEVAAARSGSLRIAYDTVLWAKVQLPW